MRAQKKDGRLSGFWSGLSAGRKTGAIIWALLTAAWLTAVVFQFLRPWPYIPLNDANVNQYAHWDELFNQTAPYWTRVLSAWAGLGFGAALWTVLFPLRTRHVLLRWALYLQTAVFALSAYILLCGLVGGIGRLIGMLYTLAVLLTPVLLTAAVILAAVILAAVSAWRLAEGKGPRAGAVIPAALFVIGYGYRLYVAVALVLSRLQGNMISGRAFMLYNGIDAILENYAAFQILEYLVSGLLLCVLARMVYLRWKEDRGASKVGRRLVSQ